MKTPKQTNELNESDFVKLQQELEAQKRVAYTTGILQGDITLRQLFESLAEGVLIINNEGRIVLTNKRLKEILGFTSTELLGEKISKLIPIESKNTHDDHILNFFRNPHMRPMGIQREIFGVHKDGHNVPLEISLSFLQPESETIALAFITDISKLTRKENELKQRNAELESFAHTLAHDINSMASNIVSMSEYLTDSPEADPEEQKSFLGLIGKSSRDLSTIVQELLKLATLDKENIQLSVIKNMHLVVHHAINRLQKIVKESNAQIKLPEQFENSFSYSPWVEEVWFNYISNALKHAGPGPMIELGSATTNDGLIKYWVKDNGPGISKDRIAEIFNPDQLPHDHGSGFGLSIVQRIIDKLDGKVEVQSEPGKGSMFCFYLPARDTSLKK